MRTFDRSADPTLANHAAKLGRRSARSLHRDNVPAPAMRKLALATGHACERKAARLRARPALATPSRAGNMLPPATIGVPLEDARVMTAANAGTENTIVAQPVAAPLSRAAIFLVVTINPGADNRTAVRSFCAGLPGLIRAVE